MTVIALFTSRSLQGGPFTFKSRVQSCVAEVATLADDQGKAAERIQGAVEAAARLEVSLDEGEAMFKRVEHTPSTHTEYTRGTHIHTSSHTRSLAIVIVKTFDTRMPLPVQMEEKATAGKMMLLADRLEEQARIRAAEVTRSITRYPPSTIVIAIANSMGTESYSHPAQHVILVNSL